MKTFNRMRPSKLPFPGCKSGRFPSSSRASRLAIRHIPMHCRAKPKLQADVVIIGSGVIGLSAAMKLLQKGATVLLVERNALSSKACTGASTGAGQGYLWMTHRSPHTAGWDLARASLKIIQQHPLEFLSRIELQATGSLLLASNQEETCSLQDRAHTLSKQGIPAKFLDAGAVCRQEPALVLPPDGSGLLVESDMQLDGKKTAAALLDSCLVFGPKFQALMGEEVIGLHLGQEPIQTETSAHILLGRLATIVAAGAWSGELLSAATGKNEYRSLLKPRKGHLIEMDRPPSMPPLNGPGMMEMSYTKHYSQNQLPANRSPMELRSGPAAATSGQPAAADITFTATTSASRSILVGSSREFVSLSEKGSSQPSTEVVHAILERARVFLPGLAGPINPELVRVGLRPFAVGGTPMTGPVAEHPGLFVAAGHEGSGLALSPATANILSCYILGNPADTLLQADTLQEVLPATRLLMAEL